MKKTVVFLFLLISFSAFCRNKYEGIIPLDKYEVVNPRLYPALDSIIKMKESMPYYKSTGLFTVEFNQDSILTDLIFVEAQENQMRYCYPDILGYFNYEGHTFIIRSDTIDTSIFKKTHKYRNFLFGIPPTQYTKEGEPIIRTNRQFAVWSMRYKGGQFKILSFFTYNEKDNWFNYLEEEYKDKYVSPSYLDSEPDKILPGKKW